MKMKVDKCKILHSEEKKTELFIYFAGLILLIQKKEPLYRHKYMWIFSNDQMQLYDPWNNKCKNYEIQF